MTRPRRVLIATLLLALGLVFAGSAIAGPHGGKAGTKAPRGPHKGASPLVVSAPAAARLPVGEATKVKVKVADHGKAPIARVMLLAKHSKAVTVKPAKAKVGTLKPHQSKSETFTVTVGAAAKAKLEFLAQAPGQGKAHDAVALKVEEAKPPDIVGRYFWNSETVLTTTDLNAYYFVDEHWVYRGVPKGGLPACSSQTASGEDDGCLPYTWDEATGALNIAGVTGEYKVGSHGLEVGSESFSEAVPPEAGTKVDASAHYINEFGICPLSCSFVNVDLVLSSGGEFARASDVAGFFGEGGSYGALPPEDHGTYSIDQRGRITFTYAEGKVVTETIAFMLDGNNNPDPNYGIVLDEADYFGPDSGV